ncbi:MAG: hypothetical protein D3917_13710 [Candidatus Electrothrix sp. AX5]|nr:hypothetical protein [Candidatus Electrothrix sp. AX5]
MPPKLSPDDTLPIKDYQITLADLSQALICYNQGWLDEYLDERGQIEVGQYLCPPTPKQSFANYRHDRKYLR